MIEPLITWPHLLKKPEIIYRNWCSCLSVYQPMELLPLELQRHYFHWHCLNGSLFVRIGVNGITEFRISHHGTCYLWSAKAWDWLQQYSSTRLSISTLRDRDALEYFLSHTAYSYLLEKIAPNLEDSMINLLIILMIWVLELSWLPSNVWVEIRSLNSSNCCWQSYTAPGVS